MNASELRALQAPLKTGYKEDPARARTRVSARGRFEAEGLTCTVETWAGPAVAGLHPATGGDGSEACSADMLLQALIACAGVTLRSVATAMEIPLKSASLEAEGYFDARGTLGVSKETPVGLTDIKLTFTIEAEAPREKLQKLVELTERYCVIYQTLRNPPKIEIALAEATLAA